MDINITKLSDKEIADICIKYNIIQSNELRNHTRNQVIGEIQKWVQYKKQAYKQRRHSSPNISMNNEVKNINTSNDNNGIKRSTSQQFNIQKTNNPATSPPQPSVNRDRRMSEPFTMGEKTAAREDHQNNWQPISSKANHKIRYHAAPFHCQAYLHNVSRH